MLLSVHSVHEHIGLASGDGGSAPVVATNLYVRGALGWRMLVHHGSPAPAETPIEPQKTLH